MRILLVGAGGVGAAFCSIAARRDFFEQLVVADYDLTRAERAAEQDERFAAARVDASDVETVTGLVCEHDITHVLNAVDPRFVMPILDWVYLAGEDYLEMAMSMSRPDRKATYDHPGFMLVD